VETSKLEFITIGEIVAPQGTKGKLKVKVLTDFPHRFDANSIVYVNHQPMAIEYSTWYKGMVVIKLPAIDSRPDAERLRGEMLEIHPSQLQPLQEGQYYLFQLIGLEVWTTAEELLGKIKEIITANSNDNYVVSGDKGEFLIPAIEDVVKSVDLETKRMVIEPLKGLLELNKKTGG